MVHGDDGPFMDSEFELAYFSSHETRLWYVQECDVYQEGKVF